MVETWSVDGDEDEMKNEEEEEEEELGRGEYEHTRGHNPDPLSLLISFVSIFLAGHVLGRSVWIGYGRRERFAGPFRWVERGWIDGSKASLGYLFLEGGRERETGRSSGSGRGLRRARLVSSLHPPVS